MKFETFPSLTFKTSCTSYHCSEDICSNLSDLSLYWPAGTGLAKKTRKQIAIAGNEYSTWNSISYSKWVTSR